MFKISERIQYLRGDRAVARWEKDAGIGTGNLHRALKEGQINDQNIRILCHYENASADWLIDGKGSPYRVSKSGSDFEMSERLQAYYDDEAEHWTVTVIRKASDGKPCAVALSMPGQYEVVQRGKDVPLKVDYTILELLSGPVGPLSSQVICRAGWRAVKGVAVDDDAAADIAGGRAGTYALFFEPGYLLDAPALDTQALAAIEAAVAESKNGYSVPLTAPEHGLLKTYRALSADDKTRLAAIAETLKSLAH